MPAEFLHIGCGDGWRVVAPPGWWSCGHRPANARRAGYRDGPVGVL